jgi:hypothetical protein
MSFVFLRIYEKHLPMMDSWGIIAPLSVDSFHLKQERMPYSGYLKMDDNSATAV